MNYVEALVAQASDLEDGQMKQVSVGKTEVLLARTGGKFYAVGAFCSHYGAPLAKGVMSGERVVCPWHNACFSLVSGDQIEPPGLDALARYEVRLEGENVIVRVPEETSGLRTPDMAAHNPDADGRVFVVLGAGAAGSAAVEMLRQTGFEGRIVMLTQEARLPYDRTRLSKDYFIGKVSPEKMPLRTPEFYQEHQIEVLCNQKVVRVNIGAKTIDFEDGTTLAYDSLLLASGGKPRRLPVEGAELKNVFTLRNFEDTNRILAAARGASRAVVVGSSFIGMEA
ncbi:MAG: FAD-dependent oxidoreductase, partial [Gemmatimonadaceae bacterium]|nr:FAD-dependent oxidoreductase [Gloeobacterales cyanobacterium ES-bin-141]